MSQPTHHHIPVLLNEVIDSLSISLTPSPERPVRRYFDGTFGRGGHYRELIHKFPTMMATVMDQDMTAIEFGHDQFKSLVQNQQLEIIHGNFADFKLHCHGTYDAILLDLGVSSPQLDEKSRGFSFYDNGPLDMRMNQGADLTAAQIINTYTEDALLQIFHRLGEISHPGKVVRAIIKDRIDKPFVSTEQLAGLIERVDGWKTKGYHPATQYFMALRLAVNNELNVIESVLPQLVDALNEGGRLAVISFHSLEDRIVKYFMRDSSLGYPLQRKVITPTEVEEKANPRSRSAKLRVFVKGLPPPKKNKYPKTEN